MPKRKAPLTDKYAAGKTGVPGGDKLTNAELSAALGPAGAILDKYEQTERNRVESTATAMHERLPEAQDHIARWFAAQTDALTETINGLRDSLRAFLDRTAEGERFRSTFLDMTPAQVDEYLHMHPADAAWLAGFSKDAKVKSDVLRKLTQPARYAARRARLMQGGRDWRDMARIYSADNDPDTGKPWRTKRRMYEWIGAKLNKDPETVRKELSLSNRK